MSRCSEYYWKYLCARALYFYTFPRTEEVHSLLRQSILKKPGQQTDSMWLMRTRKGIAQCIHTLKNNFIRGEVELPFLRIPEEDKTDWILDKLCELQEKDLWKNCSTTLEFLAVFTRNTLISALMKLCWWNRGFSSTPTSYQFILFFVVC